ncbi:MAG: glycosyltransferase [Chloroflexota bacterium]
MHIVFVYADSQEEWNSSEWRCAIPSRAINRTGRHHASLLSIESFAKNTPDALEICGGADVLVVERNLFGPVLTAIQYWKARDKVIIADFDDAYTCMHPTNLNYRFWAEGFQRETGVKIDPPPLTQFKWGLRLVHAATVPSRRLADDWRTYTEVYYLPNYIDLNMYQNSQTQTHEGVIIGWGGSMSHYQSFMESGVAEALRRVCKARPQVRVMICGNDGRIGRDLDLPTNQLIVQPWVPYSEWPSVLANFDIGLAPLFGEYDERRSWIKVLEYMVMKIPWVASDGPPYSDFRSFGWLVKNTPKAWERVLLDIVDHLVQYQQEARGGAYLAGISQAIDENINSVLATYASVYESAFGKPISIMN